MGLGQAGPGLAGHALGGGQTGGLQRVPGLPGAGQNQRGLFADIADAQAEQEAVQGDDAAGVDPGDQVADTGLAIAVLVPQQGQFFLVAGQAEDVGGLLQPAALVEGDQLLFPKTFNVKGAAADKVL